MESKAEMKTLKPLSSENKRVHHTEKLKDEKNEKVEMDKVKAKSTEVRESKTMDIKNELRRNSYGAISEESSINKSSVSNSRELSEIIKKKSSKSFRKNDDVIK